MELIAPKHFNANTVDEFLRKAEPVLKGPQKESLHIHLEPISDISIVGLLLIYKFMDYTTQKSRVKDGFITSGPYIEQVWFDYQFQELIYAYIERQKATDEDYQELRVSLKDNFIIAPQALLRNTNYSQLYLQNEFLPKISAYYSSDKTEELIFTCISEILLNFWEHAVDDTKTIILADGTKNKIEIACADTGEGIISNLEGQFPNLAKKKHEILAKALEKGVTSKKGTYHMGYGLWIVNELVKLNKGKLHLYSQGYYYKNDYGKIKKGITGFWPGTFIYVNLNLTSPQTLSDTSFASDESFNDLKINFI